ncbi:GLPGLI family protein [Elizabethkingia bruuniana]|uniref:GLPGLI family protein n=1 Tax=Elizabethkingia bruuniana TaxID=1756149 RepID=A0A7T7V0E3_9FLAO|nr:GLPGLI family protein [Elizabethkingia bruuniana]KGO11775.1 hypothetical protein KS04_02200 [Elizabethkingia miricola]AQX85776.1 hypothetical protein AYC65_12500 [Elizabethkingia bruuniana]KUY22879.1 hypothetical protein ATB97_11845 [Elizabethkingia bruuniana]OPB68678.1 hypothetical protein BAY12_00585 [Elizabethkingia bruuniana]QQN59449.1 GLPGLI family protein [Elizabethkingia bruuniana]
MKKVLLLLLSVIIFPIHTKAQSIRFEYELSQIEDTLSKYPQKFNTALEITPSVKKFYDMDIYQHDSILVKKGGSGYMNTGFDQNLLKSKSDQINQTFHNIAYDDFYRLQSKDQFNWEITKEEKNEKGYQLQKAVTNFGGRKWTAWFTQNIPIPEGPYKFSGLPGLIVEIYDSQNHYHYELTKVTKLSKASETTNILERQRGKKPIDITLAIYQRLLLDHYIEPYKHLLSSESFSLYDVTIKKEYTKTQELREAKTNEQSRIKKYYNPLELDKAVTYPE